MKIELKQVAAHSPWSELEDRALLDLARRDVRLADIAEQHGRTVLAIYNRLAKLTGFDNAYPPAEPDNTPLGDKSWSWAREERERANDVADTDTFRPRRRPAVAVARPLPRRAPTLGEFRSAMTNEI